MKQNQHQMDCIHNQYATIISITSANSSVSENVCVWAGHKHIQPAAAATHRPTPAHREDGNRGLGGDGAPAAASQHAVCGHFDLTSRLHYKLIGCWNRWRALKPAAGHLTSWVSGDTISRLESSSDRPVHTTDTFLCDVLKWFRPVMSLWSELDFTLPLSELELKHLADKLISRSENSSATIFIVSLWLKSFFFS